MTEAASTAVADKITGPSCGTVPAFDQAKLTAYMPVLMLRGRNLTSGGRIVVSSYTESNARNFAAYLLTYAVIRLNFV
jgi:hypothetical protein